MRRTILFLIAGVIALTTSCKQNSQSEAEIQHTIVYGIIADDYDLVKGEIDHGQTLGNILHSHGISALTIDQLNRASREIFPLRHIRAGQPYTLFKTKDSIASRLDYFVYEKNVTDYVVFGFVNDSITITTGQKPIELRRTKRSANIESSLWGAIMEANLPYALAAELEDVYQWTVDFFGVQAGDNFTVIYDEKFIDTLSVGVGRIWGAKFNHAGREIYAIPFKQDDKIQYWEYNGGSLRKQMLKAPLKFSRISSKFSNSRFHPVLKRYRPHHGVDYAAPTGTPVRAVADGVVVFCGWGGGGGNTLKIKHANNLMTGYLHLSRFAKGISKGKRVSQGDVIGYVGSTGTSTGPHLDYRVWKGGTPINPLKIPQNPSVPISKDNLDAFEFVRDRIVAELNGEVNDNERITQLDSIVIPESYKLQAEQSIATEPKEQQSENK